MVCPKGGVWNYDAVQGGVWKYVPGGEGGGGLSSVGGVWLNNVLTVNLFQGALGDLDHLPELTPSAVLLKCRVSILLADATNIAEGTTHLEMVQVFEGLQLQLKEQASVVSA